MYKTQQLSCTKHNKYHVQHIKNQVQQISCTKRNQYYVQHIKN